MFERRLPTGLRERESTLAVWQGSDSTAVSTLLRLLARAFAWTEEDARRLRPDDNLWAIYHFYYPQRRWWQRLKPDELEMETLYRDFEREAPGSSCAEQLHRPDVTLADLVQKLSLSPNEQTHGPARLVPKLSSERDRFDS
jgi:hypothetical protein